MAKEEQLIKEQIAAMESWAIIARQMSETGNFKEAIAQLRFVNAQGRKLEWRGGKHGLKHLPRIREVIDLKKKITEARAAAQEAQSAANRAQKSKVSKVKETSYTTAVKKYASVLIQKLKEAREIADAEPWLDFKTIISQQEGRRHLFHFRGYYSTYYPVLQKQMIIKGVETGSIPEREFGFSDLNLSWENFRGLNLKGASFYRTNLEGANFTGADLSDANFEGANLKNAVLVNANLRGARFKNATIDGMNLEGANMNLVLDITPANIYRTKNWRKARNLKSLPNFI